jgi:small-conductance mechanosensitive channel
MKTIVLNSELLNMFLVFETNKTEFELIEHLKKTRFSDEQVSFKNLVFSSDLESEIHSGHTYDGNKETERYKAVLKKESEGFNYIGANRGQDMVKKNSLALTDNVTGISGLSTFFLGMCKIVFWIVIIASIFIGLKVNIISGISMAVGAIIGFGLIFILGDLLKNTVEINRKLKK